jgi:acetyl esterase
MTMSMPGDALPTGPAGSLEHRLAGRPGRRRLALLAVLSGIGLRVMPKIPDRVKRILLGGRRVSIDGNTLDTTLQFMLTAQRAAGAGGLVASSDVDAARNQLRKLSAHLRSGVQADTSDIRIPGPAGEIPARHYRPTAAQGAPLLVFFHGGGFVIGDLESHDELCRLICRDAGIHVISVDYRLAPEHPAPAAVEDCYAAYLWCAGNAAELGADPARVAVGGDSVGGNLAAVVCQLVRADEVQAPVLQLLIYPVTDSVTDTRSKVLFAEGFFLRKADMDWFMACYLNGSALRAADPRVSPLLAEDLSGLPPALVLTGGFDPLRDEGTAYADALAAAGVPVDHRSHGSLVHGFVNFFPLGGGSATATAEMVSALKAALTA